MHNHKLKPLKCKVHSAQPASFSQPKLELQDDDWSESDEEMREIWNEVKEEALEEVDVKEEPVEEKEPAEEKLCADDPWSDIAMGKQALARCGVYYCVCWFFVFV